MWYRRAHGTRLFITACQRSCRKVMFLHLFVCPRGGGMMLVNYCLVPCSFRGRYDVTSCLVLYSFLGVVVCFQTERDRYWYLVAATEAGSMHPTGMNSCFKKNWRPCIEPPEVSWSLLWHLSHFLIAVCELVSEEIYSVISQSTKLFSLFINLERRVLTSPGKKNKHFVRCESASLFNILLE